MQGEIEIRQVEKKLRTRVKKQMEKQQKEYYLNEQMQAIQKELGDRDEFKNELNNELLPRIQEEKGFVDNLESLDPVTGEFSCTTLWETKADVDSYDNGLFQEIAAKLGPLMQGAPLHGGEHFAQRLGRPRRAAA